MQYLGWLKHTLIICSIIGMMWWFHLQNQPEVTEQEQSKPQEYMSSLLITNYSVTGKPKEILRADYWAFVPNRGQSDLRRPHVTVYKPNGDVWHLSANKAMAWHTTLSEKITQLDMLENVIIERGSDNKATPTKITTEQMQYFPATEKLISDVYIAMQQPGLLISGYGMCGYLDKNWIELHDDITTVYQSNAG